MFRAVAVWSLWMVFWDAGLAYAQDPPPLEGPASEPVPRSAGAPPTPGPSASRVRTPAVAPPGAPVQARPMLVIPGVTAPTQRVGPTTPPSIPQASQRSTSI